jgi:hypothetical protein
MSRSEPTYTRGGKTWPIIATAANGELRSLLLSGKQSIAEATVKLQLHTWKKAEAAALSQVQDSGFGQVLGIDFDNITFKGELGEHPESDVDAILEAIGPDDPPLQRDLWTWERLPYILRCVGLARSSVSGAEHKTERPAKKSRVQGRDELVPDLDEWYSPCLPFLLTIEFGPLPGSFATRSSSERSLGAVIAHQTPGSLALFV